MRWGRSLRDGNALSQLISMLCIFNLFISFIVITKDVVSVALVSC